MLGNLNKLITKMTSDKARGGSPAVSSFGSPSHSSSGDQSIESNFKEDETAEGFLCPRCMENFISPEELQSHYEATHSEIPQHICPICKDTFATGDQLQIHYTADHGSSGVQSLNGDLKVLKQELAEMHTTLKEERWYSAELKKEVTRLGGAVERDETKEAISMKQQLKAIEETKSLLTSEVVLLRKQLGEAVETHMIVKQQKDLLEQNLAKITNEKSGLLEKVADEKNFRLRLENDFQELKRLNLNLEAVVNKRDVDDHNQEVKNSLEATLKQCKELIEENQLLKKSVKDIGIEKSDSIKSLKKEIVEANRFFKDENESLLIQIESLKNDNIKMSGDMKTMQLNTEGDNKQTEKLITQLKSEIDGYKKANANFQVKCKESNEILQSVQTNYNDLKINYDTQNTDFSTLKSELQHGIESLKANLSEKCLLIDKLSAECKIKDSQIIAHKIELNDVQSVLQNQSSVVDELKLQLLNMKMEIENETRLKQQYQVRATELQSQLEKQIEMIERLNQERDDLYSKIEAGDGTNAAIQQLQLENNNLTEKLTELKNASNSESEDLKNNIEELYSQLLESKKQLQFNQDRYLKSEEKFQQLEVNYSKKVGELSEKEASWCAQKLDIEKQLQENQEALTLKNQFLNQSKESCSALEIKTDELYNHLQTKSDIIDKLQIEVVAVKEKSDQMNESFDIKEVEWKEQLYNMENIRSCLQQEVTHLSIKKSIMEEELLRLKSFVSKTALASLTFVLDIKENMSLLKRHCSVFQNSTTTEVINLKEKLNHLEKLAIERQSQLVTVKQNESSLQAELSNLRAHVSALEANSKSLQVKLDNSKVETEEFVLKYETAEASVKRQNDELNRLNHHLSTMQCQLEDSKNSLIDFQNKYDDLVINMDGVRITNEQQMNNLIESNKNQLTLEERLKTTENNLKLSQESQNILNLQKTSLETELFHSHKLLSDTEEKYAIIEVAKNDLENQLISTKADLQNQITTLEEARDFLIAQKLEQENKLNSAEAELNSAIVNNEKLIQVKEQKIGNLQKEISSYKVELKTLQESKRSVELTAEEEKTKHEMQVATLQENLSTLRRDITGYKDKIKSLETQIDEVLGEKLEMEAKLENAVDDRRALLERCLSSEADCEKLRSSASELRRKLDDALAALRELGRENQTLQMETAKLTNRKWIDDSEVNNCTSCQKSFSVTFRKHHCRNCGSILCRDCSAKTATIASFKKPVRVCDACFNELTK